MSSEINSYDDFLADFCYFLDSNFTYSSILVQYDADDVQGYKALLEALYKNRASLKWPFNTTAAWYCYFLDVFNFNMIELVEQLIPWSMRGQGKFWLCFGNGNVPNYIKDRITSLTITPNVKEIIADPNAPTINLPKLTSLTIDTDAELPDNMLECRGIKELRFKRNPKIRDICSEYAFDRNAKVIMETGSTKGMSISFAKTCVDYLQGVDVEKIRNYIKAKEEED